MKNFTVLLAGMVALLVSGEPAPQQDSKPAPPPPAARADVESIDAIVRALYDVISGPAGQDRNWNRLRSLFIPKAQLIMAVPQPDGGTRPFILTPEDYIARAGPRMRETGFFEREIARHADAYGEIAQVFSTYESRHAATDEKPFARGINSMQLMKDKDRWWVVSVFWCQETPAQPIPAEYLPK
jgi:hypothetical protein